MLIEQVSFKRKRVGKELYICYLFIPEEKIATMSYARTLTCFECKGKVSGTMSEHRKRFCTGRRRYVDDSVRSLSPPPPPDDGTKDLYFLLDISSMMNEKRIEHSRTIIHKVVSVLNKNDRVGIITFDDTPKVQLPLKSVEHLRESHDLSDALRGVVCAGKTSTYDAINLAINRIRENDRHVIVNVITGGTDYRSKTQFVIVEQKLRLCPKITLNILHMDRKIRVFDKYTRLCETGKGLYYVVDDRQAAEIGVNAIISSIANFNVACNKSVNAKEDDFEQELNELKARLI